LAKLAFSVAQEQAIEADSQEQAIEADSQEQANETAVQNHPTPFV